MRIDGKEFPMSKVLIAMSGGVDSAVAAHLVKSAGHDVIGATMKLYCPGQKLHPDENGMMVGDEMEDARAVARLVGIEHTVLNYEHEFRSLVVDSFVFEYENAKTPNPCVVCNRTLKFGKMMEAAEAYGADFLATGHYARIERDGNGRCLLRRAADPTKDQSYVLYMLTQAQLSKIMFPLGEYSKAQVRDIARELGFVNANKGDSQDICFIPDGDYATFIKEYTGKQYPEGHFVNAQGDILGNHRGIIHYTIGQRKGLGIALGHPVFVSHKDPVANTVTLSDNDSLFSKSVFVKHVNWIPFSRLDSPLRVQAKIRYNMRAQPATIEQIDDDRVHISFDQPQRAITPGQSAVFYDGEYVIGGGIIE